MKKVTVKLLLSVCAAILLSAVGPRMEAHAEETTKAVSAVNMRSGPSTSNSVLCTIPAGGKVTIYSIDTNGWYKLTYNGQTGYAYSAYVDGNGGAESSAVASYYDYVYTTTTLNMRSGPNKTYGVLTTVPEGTQVKVTATNQGWFQTTYNGVTGWLSGTFLSKDKPTGSSQSAGSAQTLVKIYPVCGLNMRSGPGVGYGVITVVPANTELKAQSSQNGWYLVTYGGCTGWVSGDLTSTSPTSSGSSSGTSATTVKYQVVGAPDGLNIRQEGNTSSAVLGVFPNGTYVSVVKSSGDWFEVVLGSGQHGYCYGEYLQIAK